MKTLSSYFRERFGRHVQPFLLPMALLFAVMTPALLAVWMLDPVAASIFPPCRFHQWTGLLCPGCGGTRAVHHLLHGRLTLAFRYNPGLFLGIPLVGALAALSAWRPRNDGLPLVPSRWLWRGAILLFFVYWVVRNLPFFEALPG
jgi:hypothetical protein